MLSSSAARAFIHAVMCFLAVAGEMLFLQHLAKELAILGLVAMLGNLAAVGSLDRATAAPNHLMRSGMFHVVTAMGVIGVGH
jgi:hypothetical protein